jgi:O-antigen ligase
LTADEQIVLLLPPTTLLLPQSAPTILAAIGLVLLITRFRDCPIVFSAIPALLRSPLAVAAGLFFIWAALSCLWSPVPGVSATALFKVLGIAAVAIFLLAVAASEPLSGDRAMRLMSAVALLSAGATLLFSLAYAQVNDLLGLAVTDLQFRRIAVILALLLPFIMAHRPFSPALRVSLCLPVIGVIFMTTSETAKSAALVAVASFLLAALAWRVALFVLAVASILTTLLMPFLLPLLQSAIRSNLNPMLGNAHAAERLEIWRQSVLLIAQRPLYGGGFESSRTLLEQLDRELLETLNIAPIVSSHPHNQILQIWIEFGVVGVALFCLVLIAVLYRIHAMPPAIRLAALSMTASLFTIAAVGHGLWQSWWVALTCALLVVVLALERRERQMHGANPSRAGGAGA